MREVTLPNGKKIEVKSLKRGQLRPLLPFGFATNLFGSVEDIGRIAPEGVERFLSLVMSDADYQSLDEFSPEQMQKIFLDCLGATYAVGREIKN